MPAFTCTVCGAAFEVAEAALAKYPGWSPKYCREHSPKKKPPAAVSANTAKKSGRSSVTLERDLSLEEVLTSFSEGPDTGLFTDGSSRPNPGPGGWGVVKVKEGVVIEQRYGHAADTTNNRMELTALIEAFSLTSPDEALNIYTDSELCVNTITKWAAAWEQNGWKRKSGPIQNLELVKKLYELAQARPKVQLTWIEAHNGWRWNEYADSLSTAWAREKL